jgi:transposase, IS30 family
MKYTHFTKSCRIELSILLKKGYSYRDIGKAIKKSPSSVSREVFENSVSGIYDPDKASHKAYIKRRRSKWQTMKIERNSKLEQYIKEKLERAWTPQEIAERLKTENNGVRIISFKLIYQWLDTVPGQPYKKFLASKRAKWKNKEDRRNDVITIKNRVPIEKRPMIINQRKRIGDFECDVLGGLKSESDRIAGVVDRKARYLDLVKVERTGLAMQGYKAMLSRHNAKSGTLDNGVENASHGILEIPTYFCDTYSSWQKGTVENTFQRLRRFINKKSPIGHLSNPDISAIVETMNDTPRKCPGWKTPKEVFLGLELEQTYANFQYIPFRLPIHGCCT